jgi:hypothetical protein
VVRQFLSQHKIAGLNDGEESGEDGVLSACGNQHALRRDGKSGSADELGAGDSVPLQSGMILIPQQAADRRVF